MTIKPKTRTPIVQALARHKAAQAALDAVGQRTIPNICAMRPSRLAPAMLNSRSTRDSDRGPTRGAWRGGWSGRNGERGADLGFELVCVAGALYPGMAFRHRDSSDEE